MPHHCRPSFAAIAALLVVLGASACGTTDDGSVRGAAEGWRRLAAAPLSPRVGHSAVWSGTQLLLWGGRVPGGGDKADGAAYDPAGDRWRRLPPAPVAGRFGHAALWTGSELLVWGGATGQDCADGCPRADGLAYRPGPR